MSTTVLPPTLTGLRQQIVAGALTVEEALRIQNNVLKTDSARWHCITHMFSAREPVNKTLPLAGIGLAHKDIFVVGNRQPQAGAPHSVTHVGRHSPLIRRLERTGSHTMAMLSMAEYACGVTGENPHLPTPVNPIDPLAAVGGSSSGSGVAVASGLCYGSLGSDTAGSIRIPAATCGVLGLKPTTGLLPSEGTSPLAESLDTVGVMTRSALDAAQIFSALLTPTQRARLFPEPYPNSGVEANAQHLITRLAAPKSLRIATCFAHPQPSFTPDEETLALLWQLALHYAGPKQPKEINLTSLSELIRCAEIMLHVEAAALHQGKLREKTHHLSDACRAVTLSGSVIPGVWYHHALKSRKAHMRAFVNAHFRDHDILLTPVLPHGVPDWSLVSTKSAEFKPRALIGLFSWTSFVNYLGLPAIVFPIGSDARGRPVCVQAIARPRAEALLLAFAHRVERDRYGCDGFIPQPSVLRPAHHLDK